MAAKRACAARWARSRFRRWCRSTRTGHFLRRSRPISRRSSRSPPSKRHRARACATLRCSCWHSARWTCCWSGCSCGRDACRSIAATLLSGGSFHQGRSRHAMGWVSEIVNPETRRWEELYRNRWQHDKVVRSTHGVNCTGGCSWNVYVKDGIVTWEMQATDYPKLGADVPPYEPRGCQRGISFSWYLYSPIRVKYPYGRGALLDLWRKAKAQHADPVEAWASIMADPERRRSYQQARGKGGFRRISWDEALEIVTASTLHTMKTYGPDRVIGFSPIPAMSMLSYAAGS